MRAQDIQLDGGLPANVDAEKTILGAVLLDPTAITEAAERLEADDFSLDSHRRIFLRMGELADAQRPIDIVTLANELARFKEIEAVGGVAFLASLTEGLPRRPVISEYIAIVKDKSLARKLMMLSSAAVARAADQSESAARTAEFLSNELEQVLSASITNRLQRVGEYLAAEFPSIDTMIEKNAKSQGIRTGFTEFDQMTCGLQRQELIIVAARPSMGKTAWAVNAVEKASIEYGLSVAFFSLEMSKRSLIERLMCSRGHVNFQDYRNGRIGTYERGYLVAAHEDLAFAQLFIDDTARIAISQVRNSCRSLKAKGPLDLVVLDHLGLMSTEGAPSKYNREQQVGWLSGGLKALAKELDVPVVALCQLSRANTQRSDKRPELSDLRESGSIEQDADLVAFLHREAYYDPKDESLQGKGEIIIRKQRNGPIGTVHVQFEESIMRWGDPVTYSADAPHGNLWGQP